MHNDQQIEMWSGPSGRRWVLHVQQTERAFGELGRLTLLALHAQKGERVADVGCGAGGTLGALSLAVGKRGSVLGVDPSEVLIEHARSRTAHLDNVWLISEDAAHFQTQVPLDALFSCLGVMFFEDPIQAFANLRHCLRPGGRLVFCCWQSVEQNIWCSAPLNAVHALIEAAPEKPPPKTPGTFSLASKPHLKAVLQSAGFIDIDIQDLRVSIPMGSGGVAAAIDFTLSIGPTASLTEKQPPAIQLLIRERLSALFLDAAQHGSSQDSLPGAAWIVSAAR